MEMASFPKPHGPASANQLFFFSFFTSTRLPRIEESYGLALDQASALLWIRLWLKGVLWLV